MEEIQKVTQTIFSEMMHSDENGEYWYARELMKVLGYETWEHFHRVIGKAKSSMLKVYPQVEDHFRVMTKKIKIAAGTNKEASRSIVDYRLSRYACYLIAQNADSTKQPIASAQSYFAIQTRKRELEEEKEQAIERVNARKKLRETEKKLSGVLTEKGLSGRDIAEIRSSGDEALFNRTTRELKEKLNIKTGSLADHLPTITIKAKDLAAEITTFNTMAKDLKQKDSIKKEHWDNNISVRKLLTEKGIKPENLPTKIDVTKLEKRIPESEMTQKKTNDFLGYSEILIDLVDVTDADQIKRVSDTISRNKGDVKLKILYGSKTRRKMITKKVNISRELIDILKRYIVLPQK